MTENDIEAELSYAYLHAVAARARIICRDATRLEDNAGIDAMLTGNGPWEDGGYLDEVDLKVQLKATTAKPSDDGLGLGYELKGIKRYNELRSERYCTPRILVVLFLPQDQAEWLQHGPEGLILRKCAYWASLRGASESENATSVTIKLPKSQVFSPLGIRRLMSRLSRRELLRYGEVL